MPIKVDDRLPARENLERENIFVMTQTRAQSQDIRPLKIIILNLMPTKIVTETQLLRLLSNSPLQVDVELLQMASHQSKNTAQDHMLTFYKTFDEIKGNKYDGMIVTGAPVELMDFEQVDYWDELCRIFEWSKTNVYSTFHICWGAQAALYYHYGIPKYTLKKKMFGIFEHQVLDAYHPILRGFDQTFFVPQSRHTEIHLQDIALCKDLQVLAYSHDAGVHLISDLACRKFFAMGHSEYDADTLAKEYFRDKERGLAIDLPKNYFPLNDPSEAPILTWRGAGTLLFSNWLNYFVYQRTPYDINSIQ